jgi:DNA-binding SARP family transcriptional activator
MDAAREAWGDWLRRSRVCAGYTQEDLAARAGVSVRALRDLERNRVRRPHASSVQRLVAALPVDDAERARVLSAAAAPDAVQVGVLGPLTVHCGHRAVDTGCGLPRTLLGLLALQPHRAVPREEIVDVLWGDRPPRSCLNLVHVYVAQVRRLLEPTRERRAPARTVVLARGGYLLDLDADRLDTARFAALAAEAGATRDAATAHERYAAALACWRGPAAADLDPGLRRHPAAVALQAAALAVYTAVRERLGDCLGIEPGPELRAAHLRVLRQEMVAPVAVRPPAQLPADPTVFIGRTQPLRRLDALLAASVNVAVVAGTAGVGKSALATHWAHRVRDRFPDGQLHADLGGTAPGAALSRFLHAVGVSRVPDEPEEAASLYRSLLADRRMLVLLDGAGHPDQVRPLLPGSPHCLVLVTSRDDLAGLVARDGARRVTLDVFSPDEAAAFLGAERVAAEPGPAAELARLCAYLPLALSIAEANLTGRPIAGFVARLRAGDRLAELAVDGDPDTSVRAAFGRSYEPLPPPARRLFRLLGLVPGPEVTVASAAALAGVEPAAAAHLLRQLAAAHLLTERAPGRFACHQLLRLYAAERSRAEDADNHRWAALRRLSAHARTRRTRRAGAIQAG